MRPCTTSQMWNGFKVDGEMGVVRHCNIVLHVRRRYLICEQQTVIFQVLFLSSSTVVFFFPIEVEAVFLVYCNKIENLSNGVTR